MLFLTEDNSFRGEDTSISLDEVIEATKVQYSAKPMIMLTPACEQAMQIALPIEKYINYNI
jgi:hypothetical protein